MTRILLDIIQLPRQLFWLSVSAIGLLCNLNARLVRAKTLAFTYILSLSAGDFETAPPGFPKSGNGLWYNKPGSVWAKEFLPIGNGYLAAMVPGGTVRETTQLNIESLWSGGPFQDPSYNGGNKLPSEKAAIAQAMQSIRQTIFNSPIGEIDSLGALATDAGAYGSYAGAGYLLSAINTAGTVTNYGRWLDLDEGVARTAWTQGGASFLRESFCSHPAKACFEHLTTAKKTTLPNITYTFSPLGEKGPPTPNVTCLDNITLSLRGYVSEPGLLYELIGRVQAVGANAKVACKAVSGKNVNAVVSVSGAVDAWITWVGGTNYDLDAGDETHNFSFKGPDPHAALVTLLPDLATYPSVLSTHIADYESVFNTFSLSLGQTPDLSVPTDELKAGYRTDEGNIYLEWIMFNYGRYLLGSSARGILPANLQGKWGNGISNAWGADYHSNINIQMNYWSAEMTGLDVMGSLFDYIEKSWAPRGAQTARTLYNISRGWVTHNEMNIFGHTGMKASGDWDSSPWANYPESAVWMMIHVWDHFDHTNDVVWWKAQGWPLIKGVASFHLDKLIPDLYFGDSTLVVNPCNSPEQSPITFGCAHAQQLIWQLFNAVEKGFEASGDTGTAFLQEVQMKRAQMDKGLRIGSWGQLQEWKVEKDSSTDKHRHLSHLIGLYPGYAITSYDAVTQGGLVNGTRLNYTNIDLVNAARVSLIHRGNGTGPDADAGWEKVWRAACWAQLGHASEFYHILSYAVMKDFGPNLLSLYDPADANPIFQIDANLGYPAAILNALIQCPDVPSLSTPLTVTLLPALPRNWASGTVTGARIRGGMTVDLYWSGGKAREVTLKVDKRARARPVQVIYGGRVVGMFTVAGGRSKTISF